MDCALRLFVNCLFEVPIQNDEINATNIESFAIESVRKWVLYGLILSRTIEKYPLTQTRFHS